MRAKRSLSTLGFLFKLSFSPGREFYGFGLAWGGGGADHPPSPPSPWSSRPLKGISTEVPNFVGSAAFFSLVWGTANGAFTKWTVSPTVFACAFAAVHTAPALLLHREAPRKKRGGGGVVLPLVMSNAFFWHGNLATDKRAGGGNDCCTLTHRSPPAPPPPLTQPDVPQHSPVHDIPPPALGTRGTGTEQRCRVTGDSNSTE